MEMNTTPTTEHRQLLLDLYRRGEAGSYQWIEYDPRPAALARNQRWMSSCAAIAMHISLGFDYDWICDEIRYDRSVRDERYRGTRPGFINAKFKEAGWTLKSRKQAGIRITAWKAARDLDHLPLVVIQATRHIMVASYGLIIDSWDSGRLDVESVWIPPHGTQPPDIGAMIASNIEKQKAATDKRHKRAVKRAEKERERAMTSDRKMMAYRSAVRNLTRLRDEVDRIGPDFPMSRCMDSLHKAKQSIHRVALFNPGFAPLEDTLNDIGIMAVHTHREDIAELEAIIRR